MMKLSYKQLLALEPCAPEERKALFKGRRSLTFADAIALGVSTSDSLWVAGRLGRKDLCVKFALACAQRVAHLNPDPRVQAALDAASAWLADPNEANRQAAARAAAAVAENEAQRALLLEIFKEV